MKRILALFLALITLLSMASCMPAMVEDSETEETETSGAANPPASTVVDDGKALPAVPQGYCAGFGREKITPSTDPALRMNSTDKGTTIHSDLYFTVVAISDGDEVAFLVHMDLKRCTVGVYDSVTKIIESETGTTADHVFLTATHTHSAPETNYAGSDAYITQWMQKTFYPAVRKAVRAAFLDLSPVDMYIGKADTTHYAHVRRYICEDGSMSGIHMAFTTGSPIKGHETLADPELQVIQFKQKDSSKKDIVMVNWQAHVAHANSADHSIVTADFVHYIRRDTEKLVGVNMAYYNGACGNINLSSKMPGLQKYTWTTVGTALALKVKEACASSEKVEMGEIKVATGIAETKYRKVDPQRVAEAKLCNTGTDAEKTSNRAKYKFQSKYEVSTIISLDKITAETYKIPLYAITFGDVAFAGASYEMFDTNGQEVKAGSPHKMTFICTCTNGSNGYIPSAFSFKQGGYEVYTCKYEAGTGELCATELLRLINTAA